MKRPGGMVKGLLVMAGIAAIGLPLYAQNIPPDEEGPSRRDRNRAQDNADYDPEPYYIDGVEYKPYNPNGSKTQKTANPQTTPKPNPAGTVQNPVQAVGAGTPVVNAPGNNNASSSSSGTAFVDATGKVVGGTSASSSSQSASEAVAAYAPEKRIRYGAAVLTVLDKVTTETIRFEAPVGKPLRYKGMVYTVKACESSAADEAMSDTAAYLEVRTSPQPAANGTVPKPKDVFKGWTYGSTPGLNPMEHPVYDVWVTTCRTPLPVAAAAKS
ncbi:DUF2155 domain-containing protein [Asticcacaulis sp. YBE204]|uniref:DUF2155 domain-containing protein n=1 Tax=Asticcacaulis sp. YBE204 TaxID=1282363 RepID=UPI0003C3F220|nr:DUF2155 domain-containing protein [Asticcacaulis sp. YBE204]ESQ78873.1 hypothetical protein AEYBE204_12895 [Asticcacaulis sp. YBE204]